MTDQLTRRKMTNEQLSIYFRHFADNATGVGSRMMRDVCNEAARRLTAPRAEQPPAEAHLDALAQIYTAAKLILQREEPVSEVAENIQRIAAAIIYGQEVPRLYKVAALRAPQPVTKEDVLSSIQCRKCLKIVKQVSLAASGWHFDTINGWRCPDCSAPTK